MQLGGGVAWLLARANSNVAAMARFDGGAMRMPVDLQTAGTDYQIAAMDGRHGARSPRGGRALFVRCDDRQRSVPVKLEICGHY